MSTRTASPRWRPFLRPLWAAPWRRWLLFHLADPHFSFMYDAPPAGEWVVLDCETTGLDPKRDEIISIGAVRIVGSRLMTSQRLELIVRPERAMAQASMRVHQLRERDVASGMPPEQAMRLLLEFIGSRPLVGYFLEFDVGMINRAIWPMLGVGLPQPKIDISALFYDLKNRQLPAHLQNQMIDLRFETIMRELDLPHRDAHDALNDAVMTGLAFLKLRSPA